MVKRRKGLPVILILLLLVLSLCACRQGTATTGQPGATMAEQSTALPAEQPKAPVTGQPATLAPEPPGTTATCLSTAVPTEIAGTKTLQILTNSMAPALAMGDSVVVKPCAPADIKVGDIITLCVDKERNMLLTHRVVNIEQTQNGLIFTTRGDANNMDDQPVPANMLVGVVVDVIRAAER